LENIKELLDENETILWQGKSDPEAVKENYLFWKDITIIFIFPLVILNVLAYIYVPPFLFFTFLLDEMVELFLIYSLTFYFLFIMDLVYVSRLRSLYLHRKIGTVSYFITSKRIFIGTHAMIDSTKFYEYSSDRCCKLSNIDFKSKGMFAFIDEKKVDQVEIQLRGDHFHAYFSYGIEENDHWRFKMGGMKKISDLSDVLVEKLKFKELKDPGLPHDLYFRE